MSVDGEYITERLFPSFVENACVKLSIGYQGFSDGWVHRLTKGDAQKWIIGYSFDINSTAASGLARDKVATSQALTAASVPAAKHYLARSRAVQAVLHTNLREITYDQPVVIKPLEGASGHGVHLFASKTEASVHLAAQPHTDWAMSPWYDIVSETRLVLLDDDLLCAYQKQKPTTRDGLILFNLGTGATAVETTPSDAAIKLAQRARRACGLRLCAVDIVQLRGGEELVLEVNEGIMMEHYARQSEAYREKASGLYAAVVERMFA